MKTTVEISDALLERARQVAARDGESLRALMEQGLRKVIAERTRRSPKFRLEDARVDGEGLQAEFGNASWDKLRDVIYEGRGT